MSAPKEEEVDVKGSMLQFVLSEARKGDAASVVEKIDAFCYQDPQNWMMNVGDVKGALLSAEVERVVSDAGADAPLALLEIGTFCGYSGVRVAQHLRAEVGDHLYTLEVNEENAAIAQQVFDHAGVSGRVSLLLGTLSDKVDELREKLGPRPLSLTFVDHWKDQYLPDFKLLLRSGLLAKGSTVVFDNVVYPGAPEVVEFVQQSPPGLFDFVLHHSELEYQSDREDAVLVVKLLRDPTPQDTE